MVTPHLSAEAIRPTLSSPALPRCNGALYRLSPGSAASLLLPSSCCSFTDDEAARRSVCDPAADSGTSPGGPEPVLASSLPCGGGKPVWAVADVVAGALLSAGDSADLLVAVEPSKSFNG